MRHTRLLPVATLFLTLSLAGAAEEKAWFGFEVRVEIEGISFNPVLQSATIVRVMPSSPAAAAGLGAGDLIVEIEGQAVPGSKARELKSAIHKAPGEALHLKIKHGTAEPRSVTLVAIAKP
jgi:C-terminal processing protease CtpA/Prc